MVTNRERVKSAKVGRPYWCDNCDGQMVSEGQSCLNCGHLQGGKKRRLPHRDVKRLPVGS